MNEGREAIRSSVRLLIVLDLPQQTTTKKKQCEDVSKLPSSEDACAFAKLHCDTGSLIPYPELYYCLAQPAGPLAAALAALLAAAALVALFRALSATAGDYFTPALTRAAAAARMPPRLAGATLLALGNGAPDIGAAVAAARGGALELAAGALLGSGLFVGCVVAGAVVRAAGGVPARGALLRDVCGYGLAVLGAVLVLSRGGAAREGKGGRGGGGGAGGEEPAPTVAGFGSAAFLLLLYLCYVLAVAGADAARIIKDARGFDEGEEEEARNGNGAGGGGGGGGTRAPLIASAFWAPPEADLPLSAAPAAALYRQSRDDRLPPPSPSHLEASAEELEMTLSGMTTTTGGGLGNGGGGGGGRSPHSARTTVSDWRASSFGGGGGGGGGSGDGGGGFSDDGGDGEDSKEGSEPPLASATASSHDQLQPRGDLFAASGSPPVAPDTEPRAARAAGAARPLFFPGGGGGGGGQGGDGPAPPPLSSRLSACLRLLDAPLAVARAMTIPVLPGGGGGAGAGAAEEDEPAGAAAWLPVALLLGPIAAALRLSPWSPSRYPLGFGVSLALGAAAGAAASVACLVSRAGEGAGGEGGEGIGGQEGEGRRQQRACASPSPAASLLLLVPSPSRRLRNLSSASVRAFSLLAAALWVDALASELVGAATLVGAVSGAPPALIGGTLLAWGNSAGDLATNVAVARRGLPNMALTACYASPLANLLLGLGAGIGLAAAGGSPVRLPAGGLSGEVAAAAAWVGAMVSTVLVVAFFGGRRLPPAASWALLAVYLCYVASGLASAAAGGGGC